MSKPKNIGPQDWADNGDGTASVAVKPPPKPINSPDLTPATRHAVNRLENMGVDFELIEATPEFTTIRFRHDGLARLLGPR